MELKETRYEIERTVATVALVKTPGQNGMVKDIAPGTIL
jgi:hypothetical protein